MSDQGDIRAAMLSALAWQVELGADEAIAEEPQDRFAQSQPKAAPVEPATAPLVKARSEDSPHASPPPRGEEKGGRQVQPGPDSTTLAQRANTLEELAEAMRSWEGSPLKEGARNFVFSDGLAGARLMVVGEAPGADEDRVGKPFVGRAGQLLDRMLAAIGLSRSDPAPETAVYIANILPWRPPGNRTPSEQEAAMFLPFMVRHIQLAKPDVILSMGNTPTKALLATGTGIKRMRGTWRRHEATGLPLLPSFHPAYLLRQPADKRLAWRDLLAVRQVLDGEAPEV